MSTKRAFLTGASEGIGRALALKLRAQGYALTLVARNEARLEELRASLSPGEHKIVKADLSLPDGIAAAEAALRAEPHSLLVNNAGYSVFGSFQKASLEDLTKMMTVNCSAVVRLSHAFLQQAAAGDSLVNIASTAAFIPLPHNSVYSATKAFVLSFTETLWYEQKNRGVHAVVVCPGYTLTEFNKRAGGKDLGLMRSIAQTPEQVADKIMKALKRRRGPVVVSGWVNEMMVQSTRLAPRKLLVNLSGMSFEKFLSLSSS